MVKVLQSPASVSGGSIQPVRGLARPPQLQLAVLNLHDQDPTVPVQAALRRGYTFITVRELYGGLMGTRLLPNRPALLIYDDGHLFQYGHVHPIVQSLGIKATIVLPSAYLNGQSTDSSLTSIYGVNGTCNTTSGNAQLTNVSSFNTTQAGQGIVVGSPLSGSGIPAGALVGSYNIAAKTINMVDSSGAAVTATATATGISYSSPATPMTWAQARAMYQSGVWDIQNHTLDHTDLTSQTSATRLTALAQCNADIVANIGCPTPIALIYPRGRYNAAVLKDQATLGFFFGFTIDNADGGTANRTTGTLEPSLVPHERAHLQRRSNVGDATWLDNMVEDVFHDFANDGDGGINAGNALGYWTGFSGTGSTALGLYNNGHEVQIWGTSALVQSADYFRVTPGGRVYYRFQFQSGPHAAGAAGVYLSQYDASKTLLGDVTLKEVTSTTALTFVEGEVALNANAKYVRIKLATDATFPSNGFMRYASGYIRPPRL